MSRPTAAAPFRVLVPRAAIVQRARELAREIQASCGDEPPYLLAVIEGALPFARLLAAALPGQLPLHAIRASSYGGGTCSSGDVAITAGDAPPVRGQAVVLIEDIVDTGRTIAALRRHLLAAGARECRVAALLEKPARRVVDAAVDHVGFVIPDEFVVGFGLDFAGRFRDLPDVVVYDPAAEPAALAGAPAGAMRPDSQPPDPRPPSSASRPGLGQTDSTIHST